MQPDIDLLKEAVRSKYRNAEAHRGKHSGLEIRADLFHGNGRTERDILLGAGKNGESAWLDAALRLINAGLLHRDWARILGLTPLREVKHA